MLPEAPPQVSIKWNEVTWYSKLGAIVLFVGVVPALSFYMGMQYQEVVDAAHYSLGGSEVHPRSRSDTTISYDLGYGESGKSVHVSLSPDWHVVWLAKYESTSNCAPYGFRFENRKYPNAMLYSTCLGRGTEGRTSVTKTTNIGGQPFTIVDFSYEGGKDLISTSYDGIPFTLKSSYIDEKLELEFYEILKTIESQEVTKIISHRNSLRSGETYTTPDKSITLSFSDSEAAPELTIRTTATTTTVTIWDKQNNDEIEILTATGKKYLVICFAAIDSMHFVIRDPDQKAVCPSSAIKMITITKTMGMVPTWTRFQVHGDFLTRTFTSSEHNEKDSVSVDARYYKTLEDILARYNLSLVKSDPIPPDAPHTGLHIEVAGKTYDWYCLVEGSECTKLANELLSSFTSSFPHQNRVD